MKDLLLKPLSSYMTVPMVPLYQLWCFYHCGLWSVDSTLKGSLKLPKPTRIQCLAGLEAWNSTVWYKEKSPRTNFSPGSTPHAGFRTSVDGRRFCRPPNLANGASTDVRILARVPNRRIIFFKIRISWGCLVYSGPKPTFYEGWTPVEGKRSVRQPNRRVVVKGLWILH